MDYQLLREKVEHIIKGLECIHDEESEKEFLDLLDLFARRMLVKLDRLDKTNNSKNN